MNKTNVCCEKNQEMNCAGLLKWCKENNVILPDAMVIDLTIRAEEESLCQTK